MTDEEFERIKDAEKEHLRAKKRLRAPLDALKRRTQSERVVKQMKRGAERLLDETGSLVDTLRRAVAQGTARLEAVLDDGPLQGADLDEAEEALREERAESLLRRYKAAQSSGARSRSIETDDVPQPDAASNGPEKTIGRMSTPRSDDESS